MSVMQYDSYCCSGFRGRDELNVGSTILRIAQTSNSPGRIEA